jgi:hypothetical protein
VRHILDVVAKAKKQALKEKARAEKANEKELAKKKKVEETKALWTKRERADFVR